MNTVADKTLPKYRISHILYDTKNISSSYRKGVFDIVFFDIIPGQIDEDGIQKTEINTNINTPKSLYCDFKFDGISVSVKNIDFSRYELLEECCMINVLHNNREIISYPLSFIPANVGNNEKGQNLPVYIYEPIKAGDLFYPKLVIVERKKVEFLKEISNALFTIKLHGVIHYER